MPHCSLLDYLDYYQRHASETAFINHHGYRPVRWTYDKVLDTARQFARELEFRQIGKGNRILLWGENRAEWVAAFLGCALGGVIVVPMDDVAAPDFAVRVHQQVDAKLVVCSRAHASQAPGPHLVLEELPATLSSRSADLYAAAELQPGDPLEIVFTSGTTAEPKGVVITHGNVLSNVEPLETEIKKYLKYERFVHPVRFLNLLPLSHVFGQFLAIFLPQLMGGTVIFQDTLKPADVINTIHREHVSVLVAVPRMLKSLKEKIERDLENDGQLNKFRETFRSAEGKHFLTRWWTFRRIHRQFGWKFWAFISGG